MNILSLFDGISCGYLALKQAGIPITKYFASEINEQAIKISRANNPDIIQLGDVRSLSLSDLPKIDILLAGSPCQDLSAAGSRQGLKGEKSKLFFEFLRIKEELNPKFWLLENSLMRKKWEEEISKLLNYNSKEINSSLFSAQSRRRLYWTNFTIPEIKEYSPQKIKDILQNSGEYFSLQEKGFSIKPTKDKEIILVATKGNGSQGQRCYSANGKSCTLVASRAEIFVTKDHVSARKLNETERERLQTLPDNYTFGTKSQRQKATGNCWTVSVITHILKGVLTEKPNKKRSRQLSLFHGDY